MNDGTATVVIVALSLAIGIFVGNVNFTYGWAMFFLSIGVLTLFYNLIKMAAKWRP